MAKDNATDPDNEFRIQTSPKTLEDSLENQGYPIASPERLADLEMHSALLDTGTRIVESDEDFPIGFSHAFIVLPDGKIILVKESDDGANLVGGKIEGKEDPIKALLRETKEEAGIDFPSPDDQPTIHHLCNVQVYGKEIATSVHVIFLKGEEVGIIQHDELNVAETERAEYIIFVEPADYFRAFSDDNPTFAEEFQLAYSRFLAERSEDT
jgi:8-oxo-dGTP pyrophosphatase MutT (NUDIX family)